MPFNGSGVWSAPSLPGSFNPAISGQQGTPTDWNTFLTDMSSGLSTMICRDGQSAVTADIPFAGFRLKGVGNGVLGTDAANMSQLVSGAGVYAADTGAVNVITLAPTPAISAYAVGQKFRFKANHTTTTTTPTAAVSGLTAGTIVCPDGTALPAGAIVLGGFYEITVSAATPTFQLGATISATDAQASNDLKNATTAYVDRVAVQQVQKLITGAVATGSTVLPLDDTIPQNTEGDEYMTLAITPKSATSKLIINVVVQASHNLGSANNITAALFQDSTANALAAMFAASSAQFEGVNLSFTWEMVSGTTSATTFKVRAGPSSAAVLTFNGAASARLLGGVMASSIIITEIGV